MWHWVVVLVAFFRCLIATSTARRVSAYPVQLGLTTRTALQGSLGPTSANTPSIFGLRHKNNGGCSGGHCKITFNGACSLAFVNPTRVKLAFEIAVRQVTSCNLCNKPGVVFKGERGVRLVPAASRKRPGHLLAHSPDGSFSEDSFGLGPALSGPLLPPRGFRDFPPSAFGIHKQIFFVWREVAEEFGFQEYKGPSVEHSVLFSHFAQAGSTSANPASIAGSAAVSPARPCVDIPPHIYCLQGKRLGALCLRPELTPSVARMLHREQLRRPSGLARRWYSIERVWRHERPGCGRRREHFQWNMDIAVHCSSRKIRAAQGCEGGEVIVDEGQPTGGGRMLYFCPQAVSELIAAAVRLFQKLRLTPADVRIRVGSRSLLSDLLRTQDELGSNSKPAEASFSDRSAPVTALESGGLAQKHVKALHILDRARRRSLKDTRAALAEALDISHDSSGRVIERLCSFDVNNNAMVQDLAKRLRRLGAVRNAVGKQPSGTQSLLGEKLPGSVAEMRVLLGLLNDGYGVLDWVDVDLLIVRGLHYYTGLVFEAFDADGAFRAILGGGCYGGPAAFSAKARNSAESHYPLTAINQNVSSRNVSKINEYDGRAGSLTGAGMGMGDCVLLELLQRKRLVPVAGATLDVVVALRQESYSLPPHEPLSHGSALCGGITTHASLARSDSKDSCPVSSSSLLFSQVAEAQALCRLLRIKGFRVELLFPPQKSERVSVRHAKSLGAKAVVFVSCSLGLEKAGASQRCLPRALKWESGRVADVHLDVVLLKPGFEESWIDASESRECLQTGGRDAPSEAATADLQEEGGVKATKTDAESVVAFLADALSRHAGTRSASDKQTQKSSTRI